MFEWLIASTPTILFLFVVVILPLNFIKNDISTRKYLHNLLAINFHTMLEILLENQWCNVKQLRKENFQRVALSWMARIPLWYVKHFTSCSKLGLEWRNFQMRHKVKLKNKWTNFLSLSNYITAIFRSLPQPFEII